MSFTYRWRDVRANRNRWKVKQVEQAGLEITIISPFVRPFGISLNGGGNTYISDFNAHRVLRFAPDWAFNGWLGLPRNSATPADGWSHATGGAMEGSGPGMLSKPHAVEFDGHGNLYVTEFGNRRIQKFSSEGKPLGFLADTVPPDTPSVAGPATAYFSGDGRLYVTDYSNHAVYKFTADGVFEGWLGARDGGVSDGFSTSGKPVETGKPGGFNKPHAARTDRDGNLIVADTWNHRLTRHRSDGAFMGWIGGHAGGSVTDGWEEDGEAVESAEPGGFHAPISLHFDDKGDLIIAEYGNHRIQKFSPEGRFVGWFGGKAGGGCTRQWETEGLPRSGDGPGNFLHPYDACVHGGALYVADTENGRIQVIRFH